MMQFLFNQTPLFFFFQSFWRDEAFSYLLAKKNILQIVILSAKDFTPFFYYIILHFWMKLFGTSEIAIRSLSFVCYWLIIYVAFYFLKNVFRLKTLPAFFYLLFFIINPSLVYYAFEARPYALFAFLATLSYYSFYKQRGRLYLIATVLGLFTHYFMIFVVISQLLYAWVFKKIFVKKITNISLLFSPWIVYVLINNRSLSQSFWISKFNLLSVFNLPALVYLGYEYDWQYYDKSVISLSLIFFSLLIYRLIRHRNINRNNHNLVFNYLLFWLCIPLIIVIFISFFKPLILSRYLIFSCIGLILLVIFILEKLPLIPKLLIISIIFIQTVNYQQLAVKNRRKSDLRTTIKEIKILANKQDLLYVESELDFHTAQYYFDDKRVYIYGKNYEEIPAYVGKILIAKENIAHNLPSYPKKAFILKSDGGYYIQSLY